MNYPFQLPGHPDLNLSLQTSNFWLSKILKDGVPLEKVDGVTFVPLADGSSLELKLKYGFDLSGPKVEFKRQTIEVMPTLSVLWVIWAYLPLVLMFIGGAIGGGCGGAAMGGTLSVLRSDWPRPIRILLGIVIPPLGFLAYWIIVWRVLKWRQ